LPDEFSPLPYEGGAVGMATAGPDSAGSQWFVTLSPQPHLDGDYPIFGQLVQGHDTLRRLREGDRIERVIIERSRAPSSHP
jgi:peptidyl-prolyl cis-trans isomerase B (cyclophilin B)